VKISLLLITFFFVFGWKITPLLDVIFITSMAVTYIVFLVLHAPIDKRSLSVFSSLFALAA